MALFSQKQTNKNKTNPQTERQQTQTDPKLNPTMKLLLNEFPSVTVLAMLQS